MVMFLLLLITSCASPPYTKTTDPKRLVTLATIRINTDDNYYNLMVARKALNKSMEVSNNGKGMDSFTLARYYNALGRTYTYQVKTPWILQTTRHQQEREKVETRKIIDKAQKYYKKSLTISKKNGYRGLLISAYYNLAIVYKHRKYSNAACESLSKAAEAYSKLIKDPADYPYGFGEENGPNKQASLVKTKLNEFSKKMFCGISL